MVGDLLLSSYLLYYFTKFTDLLKQLWYIGNELMQNLQEPTVEAFSDSKLDTLKIIYWYLYPKLDQRGVVFLPSF